MDKQPETSDFKSEKTTQPSESESYAIYALLPEKPALTAIKNIIFDPSTAEKINSCDLVKEIRKEVREIQHGNFKSIERRLLSQAIVLSSVFDRMLAQLGSAKFTNQVQVFGHLALKAQAQCRVTLATLADLRNPQKTTFIKQQNNAVNQQINTEVKSENPRNFKNSSNELLSEKKHEAMDFRGAQGAVGVNSSVETMETVNRGKNS
ncbi:MAG: hypothetical protein ACD_44C00096G0003 [uncultured bacterium]|nr:MAG: hypothetical protein ACD_44C00096G0003 [uncultured bacterium]OGT16880.1 MAG: hypothetical protein A3B69_01205 [Gammaproteobacteria bacterium RIFCSPHIGHO2_02_FULL_38_33]OGT24835.1 MAG: hypothetical protein A2W47_07635 [Gammaproteobacteria bacterium RIFCSPHIGHO2_12_38_15]OGT68607.1 MAG: hypothetical protein A3I12_00435 [Gammaproteobacteria bacterium RIFCSPLOWO2_02_FULL_38_11]OGT75384.1 MAG: hypothetical protein A3G71_02945 [Gammaproteobacteria bacterium RIFCSPLOWO2_12_FULL_38_14]